MEIAFFGSTLISIALSIVILVQGKRDAQEREKLLDRIQAPQAVQNRVVYEDFLKLPTPEAPTFDSDEEFHQVKAEG